MLPFDRNEKSQARDLKEKVGMIPEMGKGARITS
jgi:hypothetical protein